MEDFTVKNIQKVSTVPCNNYPRKCSKQSGFGTILDISNVFVGSQFNLVSKDFDAVKHVHNTDPQQLSSVQVKADMGKFIDDNPGIYLNARLEADRWLPSQWERIARIGPRRVRHWNKSIRRTLICYQLFCRWLTVCSFRGVTFVWHFQQKLHCGYVQSLWSSCISTISVRSSCQSCMKTVRC